MANGHGGYREPGKPAAASGPGSLSQRTDGGPERQAQMIASGGEYGDRKEMEAIQSSAAMQGGGGEQPPPNVVPIDAPSQRPDEPVTAGAALGPGVGPEAVGILDDEAGTIEQLRPLLRSMETIANLPNSTPQFRSFVRKLKAKASGQQPPM